MAQPPNQLFALLFSGGLFGTAIYLMATDAWGVRTAVLGGPTSFRRFAVRMIPGVHPDVAAATLLGTVLLLVAIAVLALTQGGSNRR